MYSSQVYKEAKDGSPSPQALMVVNLEPSQCNLHRAYASPTDTAILSALTSSMAVVSSSPPASVFPAPFLPSTSHSGQELVSEVRLPEMESQLHCLVS